MMEETWLSRSTTTAGYRELERNRDREAIISFVSERFSERYILPLRGPTKHGFCTMAVCCLMIEALESFYQGWPDTIGISRKAFLSFFGRCAEEGSELAVLADHVDDFYTGVRCGILHQAETTKGWRIIRKGPLFDPATKTINATRFLKGLEEALMAYHNRLQQSDWDSEIWRNLVSKMNAVIENCRPI